MSYHPQRDSLDFEIGAFGDGLKKLGKGAMKGLNKVTEFTITKPSMMIGKAIGGKKGEALGKKLGGFTSTVTKIGVGAGVGGALLPAIAPVGVPVATALLAKKAMGGRKGGMHIAAGMKHLGDSKPKKSRPHERHPKAHKQACKTDNSLAAKVAAVLVAKLGGPLDQANKALKLAELQRAATYEHKALMSNAEFRKKVLSGINEMAAKGNADCQRTIRVLVGR